MAYSLENRLVVGIASSALFDLKESNDVFERDGERGYRAFQEGRLEDPLMPGVAFPFIRRLLSLNQLLREEEEHYIEVIVLSRNDPDTGMRVLKSIQHHGLDISRAIFMEGKSPYDYIPALNVSLFLSANEKDVREAIELGFPAGRVMPSAAIDDEGDEDLRIAFDFDGVLVDDEAEQVMQTSGLDNFHQHEVANLVTPHTAGPLKDFLVKISRIQNYEVERKLKDPDYRKRLHVAMVTARNAPSHERAIRTLKDWGVMVNDAFFLGGIDKGVILGVLRPHIFFDDQAGHLKSTAAVAPSVHVPFGRLNQVV